MITSDGYAEWDQLMRKIEDQADALLSQLLVSSVADYVHPEVVEEDDHGR